MAPTDRGNEGWRDVLDELADRGLTAHELAVVEDLPLERVRYWVRLATVKRSQGGAWVGNGS